MMAIPILAIIFGFVFFIVKMAMDHERAKLSLKAGGDKSMTTSELKALIEEAVQNAVAPLEKRIEELASGSVSDVQELPEAESFLDLDEFDEQTEEEAESTRSKQRAR